jgi:hypothetical protein
MSNDTMPCGCDGHADNASLCRYPALEKEANNYHRALTAALEEVTRLRQRAEQAERQVSLWKIATGASEPQHAQDALHNLRDDLRRAEQERDEACGYMTAYEDAATKEKDARERAEADNAALGKAP